MALITQGTGESWPEFEQKLFSRLLIRNLNISTQNSKWWNQNSAENLLK